MTMNVTVNRRCGRVDGVDGFDGLGVLEGVFPGAVRTDEVDVVCIQDFP